MVYSSSTAIGPGYSLTILGFRASCIGVLNRCYSQACSIVRPQPAALAVQGRVLQYPRVLYRYKHSAVLQYSSKSRSYSTSNSYALRSKAAPKVGNKLGLRLSNLKSIYNSSSPIFKELLEILNNEPLNRITQLKIEKFLLDQASEFNKEKLESGEGYRNSNISNPLTLEFVESKKILAKLIKNYQTNLKLEDASPEALSSLDSRIMCSMDYKFLIAISYGRLLNIINSHQHVNKLNQLLDVSLELGKEIIKKYLFDSYHAFLKQSSASYSNGLQEVHLQEVGNQSPENTTTYANARPSLLMWKNNNKTLVESTENSQLRYDLGIILVN